MSDINVQTFSGKVNITSNLLVGTSHFFVDTTNNRVGITTASPSASLDVNGDVNVGTNITFGGVLTGNGSGLTSVNSDSGSWVNGTNSNVHLATSTDNVGIGTTSPRAPLTIQPSSTTGEGIHSGICIDHDTAHAQAKRGVAWHNTNQNFEMGAIRMEVGGSYNSCKMSFFTSVNKATATEKMRLDHDGNLGIGVSDPDSKLEVRGNIRASFSDTDHGMFIDAGGTILRNYDGANGSGFHFTTNAIWPTNYLGAYSAGGIDLGSSTYRWNNIYTEALNASGTIDSTGIITCNANKMVITGSSPTLYLRDSNARTGMIHQNDNRMYFLSGPANSDTWTQTANSRWPLYLQMDTNEAVFGGNIDATVGTVTASTFSTTSQLYLGTSASIRQTSTSPWTGDPGSGVGKIEYHSNRWYIVAGSNSTELLRVRRNDTDKFIIDNNGSISLGIVPAARISGTVASATTAGSVTGQSQINKSAHSSGANDYHLELFSGNTGSSSNEVSIRFHQGSVWWGQIRFRSSQFYFTSGGDNSLYAINTGSIYNSGSLESDGRIYADNGCHVRGDWLRVNGNAGIYFESYGGGWYMTDSTYIRNYGSKMLLIEGSGARIYGLEATVNYSSSSTGYRAVGVVSDPANYSFSLYVDKSVRAAGFVAFSDRRIKSNVVDINDTYALEQVRKLKPKYYDYVDKVARGDSSVIGFIAQEVKEVVPRAVSVSDGDVPNIYETGNIGPGNTITFTKFDTSTLESSTKTLIVYLSKQDRKEVTVAEIIDKHTLRVEEDISEWGRSMTEDGKLIYEEKIMTVTPEEYKNLEDKMGYEPVVTGYSNGVDTISMEEYDALDDKTGYSEFIGHYEINKKIYEGTEIFVWGQKVNDFHHLNKDYLWTIGTAALQEVDRQLQTEKAKTYELRQKVELLEMSHASLIQRIEALEKL